MEFAFANDSFNESNFRDDSFSFQHNVLFTVFAIGTTISSVCDLLIIISILQHSVMRTKRNLLILNWAFADFFFQLQEPSKYFLLHSWFGADFIMSFGCVLFQHEAIFLCLICLFVLILNVNFVYKRLTIFSVKIVAGVSWLLTISTVIVTTYICMINNYFYVYLLLLLLIVLIFTSYIVKLVMYSIRRINKKEKDTKLRYILCAGFTLCFVPGFILFCISHTETNIEIFLFLSLTGNLNPILNVFLLYKYDKNFKLSFLNIIRCKPAGYLGSSLSYDTSLNVSSNVVQSMNMQD